MKQYPFSIMPFLFTTLLFIQCNNNNGNPGNSPIGDGCKLTWKLDGESDSAEPIICAYVENTMNLGLIGSNMIQLQVSNLTGPGSFDVKDNDAVVLLKKDGKSLVMVKGSINVTQISNSKAKGNFSGTMRDPNDNQITGQAYNLSNGAFTAKFLGAGN